MYWNQGYGSSYYACTIDRVTWRETGRFEITGGSITRGADGLRDAADIEATGYDGREQYIRIYLDTKQSGSNDHVPLFTGLAISPKRKSKGNYATNTLQCYSVLKAAADVYLDRGYYAPSGVDSVRVIRELLSVVPSPVEAPDDAPELVSSIIAEERETRLSMVDKILSSLDWIMQIKGDGTIMIMPRPTEPVASFDPVENDSIESEVEIEHDMYSAPNVFRAISDGMSAVAKDESPESPLSIYNRGREVWAEENSVKLNAGETLPEYAVRRLKELQQVSIKASYDRRYKPNIYVNSIIRLHYPAQQLDGMFRVQSQKITLTFGATTSEEVVKI